MAHWGVRLRLTSGYCWYSVYVQVSNDVVSIVDLWAVSSGTGELIIAVDLVSVVGSAGWTDASIASPASITITRMGE